MAFEGIAKTETSNYLRTMEEGINSAINTMQLPWMNAFSATDTKVITALFELMKVYPATKEYLLKIADSYDALWYKTKEMEHNNEELNKKVDYLVKMVEDLSK